MSAISSNGTGGGNWSAGATWAGGVKPAVGDTVMAKAIGEAIKHHVGMCPWGKKLMIIIALATGVSIGTGLISGITISKILVGYLR